MGCICIGFGVTMSGVLFPRLRAAQALHRRFQPGLEQEAYPKDLLDRYVARFASTTRVIGESTTQLA